MDDQPEAVDFMYVGTEIPPGVTLKAWRAQPSSNVKSVKATSRSRLPTLRPFERSKSPSTAAALRGILRSSSATNRVPAATARTKSSSATSPMRR